MQFSARDTIGISVLIRLHNVHNAERTSFPFEFWVGCGLNERKGAQTNGGSVRSVAGNRKYMLHGSVLPPWTVVRRCEILGFTVQK